MVPICIISFNNGRYVRNMVDQLCRIIPNCQESIWIVDNCSTEAETLEYLASVPVRVIRNPTNVGPWISPTQNAGIYAELPDMFVLTDPDLQLNERIPSDFIDRMCQLALQFGTSKLGLALDISDPSLLLEGDYVEGRTIAQHESQFWHNRVPHPDYEIYRSALDTTFCVVNKRVFDHPAHHMRIAGDFTAKHIPWYKKNPLYSPADLAAMIGQQTRISTTSQLIRKNLEAGWLS